MELSPITISEVCTIIASNLSSKNANNPDDRLACARIIASLLESRQPKRTTPREITVKREDGSVEISDGWPGPISLMNIWDILCSNIFSKNADDPSEIIECAKIVIYYIEQNLNEL